MPQPISCNGCGRKFSSSQYRRSHLSQTTDPKCQAEKRSFLVCHSPDNSLALPRRSPPSPSSPVLPQPESFPTAPAQLLEPDNDDTSDKTSTTDDNDDNDNEQAIRSEPDENSGDDEHGRFLSIDEVTRLHGELWGKVHIEQYPGRNAGAIHFCSIPTMKEFENLLGGPSSNAYVPFNSQTDWELAKWAKSRGPGSSAFTELMGITDVRPALLLQVPSSTDSKQQLHQRLGTSYRNTKELNKKIDSLPTRRPKFGRKRVEHAGETHEFFYRDIIECIRELFGCHDFVPYLKFKPERHYADADKTIRIYNEMHTGRWWWKIQVCATVF